MEITIKWTIDSKSDEEAKKKVMALLKNAQGTLLHPLPDWDPEELRTEIQDLKLENDLLKKRDEIMLKFIRSVACVNCNNECVFNAKPGCSASVLDNTAFSLSKVFKDAADNVLKELDNL